MSVHHSNRQEEKNSLPLRNENSIENEISVHSTQPAHGIFLRIL